MASSIQYRNDILQIDIYHVRKKKRRLNSNQNWISWFQLVEREKERKEERFDERFFVMGESNAIYFVNFGQIANDPIQG